MCASAAIVAILLGAGSASAACRVWGAQGIPNGVASMRMSVGSGENCVIRNFTQTWGKNDGRRFPTTDLSVTSQPAHGRVSENGSRLTYVSSKGYRGADSFTYRSRTQGGPVSRTFTYRVIVEVY